MENNISSGESPKLFSNRVFQAIIVSGLFLQIGIWVRNFAVLLFVMEHTNGDPFAVSMISVAEFAPIFIFSFIGGTFADRWNPKKTMVWCDILSAVSVFAVLIYANIRNLASGIFCNINLCDPFTIFAAFGNEVI